jgi:hypothetical protein
MRMPRLLHGEFIGRPSGWTSAGEQDHILECPVCGQTFDMCDLGQALDHWHDGPADDGSGPLAKLKHNLPPVAGDRGTRSKPICGPRLACGFLTTSPNATVQHGGQRPRRLAKGKGARDARTKHKV